jgi:hypothetical protein
MGKGNDENDEEFTISSIGISAPSFLTVTNSPITESGVINLQYNNTPLPISSGGTGITHSGGQGQVLGMVNTNPDMMGWMTVSGMGTVTEIDIDVPSFLQVNSEPITTSGTLQVSLSGQALPVTSGGTGLSIPGIEGQVLTTSQNSLSWQTPTTGTVTSVGINSENTIFSTSEPITSSGSINLEYNNTPLPTTSGGTGLTSIGQMNQVLTSQGTFLDWQSPVVGVTSVGLDCSEIFLSPSTTITSSGDIKLSYKPDSCLPTSYGGTGLQSIGAANQVLTSSGETLIWSTPTTGTVTSVGIETSLDSILSISNNPITSDGSITISYSGNALPTSSGGTGLTTIGTEGQVLTVTENNNLIWSTPTFPPPPEYPAISATLPLSCSVNNEIFISSSTGQGKVVLDNSPELLAPTLIDPTTASLELTNPTNGSIKLKAPTNCSYNLILPTSSGFVGQVLTSQGSATAQTWTTPSTGTVTSVGIDVSEVPMLTASSPITSTGSIKLELNKTLIDITPQAIITKKPLIENNGVTAITENISLTEEQFFSFLDILAVTEVTITLPSLLSISTYINTSLSGNTFTGIIQNMNSTPVNFIAGENLTIVDGRSINSLAVQSFIFYQAGPTTGIILLK